MMFLFRVYSVSYTHLGGVAPADVGVLLGAVGVDRKLTGENSLLRFYVSHHWLRQSGFGGSRWPLYGEQGQQHDQVLGKLTHPILTPSNTAFLVTCSPVIRERQSNDSSSKLSVLSPSWALLTS